NTTANQTDSSRRGSDWRTRLRQIYAPPSDDDRFDQEGAISTLTCRLCFYDDLDNTKKVEIVLRDETISPRWSSSLIRNTFE
ncbi:unnamed protein product, partial [Rotaria magnacalcarata]